MFRVPGYGVLLMTGVKSKRGMTAVKLGEKSSNGSRLLEEGFHYIEK